MGESEEWKALVDSPSFKIPQHPQRQDSLTDQLKDLHIAAARLGLYDAADWLWKAMVEGDRHFVCPNCGRGCCDVVNRICCLGIGCATGSDG